MSVIIEEGVPGAGKSFDALTRFALGAIRAGRKLITNIDGLNYPLIASLTGKTHAEVRTLIYEVKTRAEWYQIMRISESDMVDSRAKMNPLFKTICIIDESQMVWPRGSFQKTTTQGFKDLLAWHRHLDMDIIFLTQSSRNLESYVSEICEACYSVKNLAFISAVMGKAYVINVREKPGAPLTTTLYGRYDPKYFGIYKSTVAGGAKAFKLKVPQAIGGVVGATVLGVALYLGAHFYSHGILGGGKIKKHGLPSHSVSVVGAKKDLDLAGRDAVASPPSVVGAPVVASPVAAALAFSPMPPEASDIEKREAGEDPARKCFKVPGRATWSITFRGETERGWKPVVKLVCM